SDRGLEEDDPGLGSPYRSAEFYEGIDDDWGYGGNGSIRGWIRDWIRSRARSRIRGFSGWERKRFCLFWWLLGMDGADKSADD
ncbi:MAG: hypothetical protein ABI955_11845, partial [Nitrospirota bacterium]